MVCDLDDRLIYWNKSAERLYGWTAVEAIGQNADQFLFKNESPQFLQMKRQLLERSEWVGELPQITKEGKPVTVESRWTLVRDGDSSPKSKLVINTDITERKKLEAQFLRAQRMETLLETKPYDAMSLRVAKGQLYAYRGDMDHAIEWVQKGLNERAPNMIYLKAAPAWDFARNDSRFQELLRHMNFPSE